MNTARSPLLQRPARLAGQLFMASLKSAKMVLFQKRGQQKHAVTHSKPHVKPLLKEYLNTFAKSLEDFRVAYTQNDAVPFDDKVVKSITSFLGHRDNFIEFVSFACGYMDNEDTYDQIHSFLEEILAYKIRRPGIGYYEEDHDNYEFILYEMLLYLLAILIREKKFAVATQFMEWDYHYVNGIGSPEFRQDGIGTAFYSFVRALSERRARRRDVTGPKSTADFIHARATTDIKFTELVQADMLIYITTVRLYVE